MYFGEGADFNPCPTVSAVFDSVECGDARAGIVPVENSIGGNVYETYDRLLSGPLFITGEFYLRISHCLISLEGVKTEDIAEVRSHPQALEQCRNYIRRMGFHALPSYDTAGSLRDLKASRSRNTAVIAGENAAPVYGMQILDREIQDHHNNYTRFIIVERECQICTGRCKSSIIVSLAHKPGSLFRALGSFAERDINLTKIESRPIPESPWHYYFFIDLEGSSEERNVRDALEELSSGSSFFRFLGSYARADFQ